MKIVTYNMCNGGRKGENWRHVLDAFAPDLVLAQEAYDPRQCNLAANAESNSTWLPVSPNTRWGSAIYVRSGSIQPVRLADCPQWMTGWMVCGDVQFDGESDCGSRSIRVFSLHAPPKKVSGVSYPNAVNSLLNVIARNRGAGELLVGGDFNLYSLGTRRPSETWNGKSWKTTAAESSILKRLDIEFGLAHCWQTALPNSPLPQTLRVKNSPTRPLHCDGIFVPKSWNAKIACSVADGQEWTTPVDGWEGSRSDHNPIVALLTFDKLADIR